MNELTVKEAAVIKREFSKWLTASKERLISLYMNGDKEVTAIMDTPTRKARMNMLLRYWLKDTADELDTADMSK